ncbi:MAG: hypothetical protein ACXW1P_05290 [Methylophilaceae bacterium]
MSVVRKTLWVLALAISLSVAGWFYLAKPLDAPVTPITCANIIEGCGNQALKVRLDQVPHVMKPFKLLIEAGGAREVHASIAMQGMEMGLNRYRLIRQADNSWKAEVTLPVCIQGRSDWVMLVEVAEVVGAKHYQLAFQALP